MTRTGFLAALAGANLDGSTPERQKVQCVGGELDPKRLGITLMHEHVLVDFIGADQASPRRYDADEVFPALPRLRDLRARGCRALVECTPAYLGRDPVLLRRLSKAADLPIVTNTGWYGANRGKHLPALVSSESVSQIAGRWIAEYRDGINGTGVRPGFIKTGVNAGRLSDIDRKLIIASCLCHKSTGLRIHAHTGNGEAALEILAELRRNDVPASAFVWVHAQNEKDTMVHERAAKEGAFIEFDGVNARNLESHVRFSTGMIAKGHIDLLLLSQDSGWYRVGEPAGGTFNGYTYLFDTFIPALRDSGVSDMQLKQIMASNPAKVLGWTTT